MSRTDDIRTNGTDDAATGRHYALHFRYRCGFVRYELQTKLAEHDIEGVVTKRQRLCIRLPPVDWRVSWSG